jgi:hypothetical protein
MTNDGIDGFKLLNDLHYTYKRLACINMFLILALPLVSASQNVQVRFFISSIRGSLVIGIYFFVILILVSISILFYGI